MTLPFQFMIAFTGIAFSATTYLPVGVPADLAKSEAIVRPEPAPLLDPLVARAGAILERPAYAVVVDRPNHEVMRIQVFGSNEPRAEGRRINQSVGIVTFDASSGAISRIQRSGEGNGPGTTAHGVLDSLHIADFGGRPVKWLYFIVGLAGTAMMGTGTIMFVVKRRSRQVGTDIGRSEDQSPDRNHERGSHRGPRHRVRSLSLRWNW